jgi:hypothetical protein
MWLILRLLRFGLYFILAVVVVGGLIWAFFERQRR